MFPLWESGIPIYAVLCFPPPLPMGTSRQNGKSKIFSWLNSKQGSKQRWTPPWSAMVLVQGPRSKDNQVNGKTSSLPTPGIPHLNDAEFCLVFPWNGRKPGIANPTEKAAQFFQNLCSFLGERPFHKIAEHSFGCRGNAEKQTLPTSRGENFVKQKMSDSAAPYRDGRERQGKEQKRLRVVRFSQ